MENKLVKCQRAYDLDSINPEFARRMAAIASRIYTLNHISNDGRPSEYSGPLSYPESSLSTDAFENKMKVFRNKYGTVRFCSQPALANEFEGIKPMCAVKSAINCPYAIQVK